MTGKAFSRFYGGAMTRTARTGCTAGRVASCSRATATAAASRKICDALQPDSEIGTSRPVTTEPAGAGLCSRARRSRRSRPVRTRVRLRRAPGFPGARTCSTRSKNSKTGGGAAAASAMRDPPAAALRAPLREDPNDLERRITSGAEVRARRERRSLISKPSSKQRVPDDACAPDERAADAACACPRRRGSTADVPRTGKRAGQQRRKEASAGRPRDRDRIAGTAASG